jgi:hypothetical protein
MEDPRWLDPGDQCPHRASICQIGMVEMYVVPKSLDAPRGKLRTEKQMNLVPVRQQPEREIRSDESRRTGDENALQGLRKFL